MRAPFMDEGPYLVATMMDVAATIITLSNNKLLLRIIIERLRRTKMADDKY